MKICSKCNNTYDDSWNVCLRCDNSLRAVPSATPITHPMDIPGVTQCLIRAVGKDGVSTDSFDVLLPSRTIRKLPKLDEASRRRNDDVKKAEENTPLFWICIGIYFILGIVFRFTDFLRGDVPWYHVLIIAPFGLIGLLMQIYPCMYIEAKLKKWGMRPDKANKVATLFWLGCLAVWYLVFVLMRPEFL